jgi:hypothetical protein
VWGPAQIELVQGLLTGPADVFTQLSARTDADVFPVDPAERSVDGAKEVNDGVRAHTLDEGDEVEQLIVSTLLVGMVSVVGEGAMIVYVSAQFYCCQLLAFVGNGVRDDTDHTPLLVSHGKASKKYHEAGEQGSNSHLGMHYTAYKEKGEFKKIIQLIPSHAGNQVG